MGADFLAGNNLPPNEGFDLVIEPGKGIGRYWHDLWRYRELFLFLAWRDLLVRYKQTLFGVAWSLLRPLLMMAVFTFVFGRIAKLPSDGGVPYPVMVFAALLPWQLFSGALTACSNSLVANAQMLTRVYFPRMILPASTLIVALADFFITLCLFFGLMAFFHVGLTWRLLAIPFLLLLALVPTLGAGLWLAALTVRYRDFRFIVPFIVQLGLYVSPVGFSSSVVPEKWRLLYSLNPMVGVIDGFRWAFLGQEGALYLPGLALSVVFSLGLFTVGIGYFRKVEKTFADTI